MQSTLKTAVAFEGVGLHSGLRSRMVVRPAPVDFGIKFKRTDVIGRNAIVPARFDLVEQRPLCTQLVNADGVAVQTVEHIMAALAGCGVHNALVEVSGLEIPILDGCSATFVRAFIAAGLQHQTAPLQAIEILGPVFVEHNGAVAMLAPGRSLEINFRISFSDAAIGTQSKQLNMANGAFVRELSDSRTFCRKDDIDSMHAQGLALGGTYENAVVVDGASVLSPGGLRHPDEAVRHKMLDALGDLALAGAPILGRYTGIRAGHAMTNKLLRKLFASDGTWRMVTCTEDQIRRLPGTGVRASDLALVA